MRVFPRSSLTCASMLTMLFTLIIAGGCMTVPVAPTATNIAPHVLFADNMVLQRDIAAPVWGTADAGGAVTVTLCGRKATAVADANGNWMARLRPLKAGGPHELTISGTEIITIHNVMIGDVWICSGQSNMEQGIGHCANPTEEIAAADHPGIRLFMVPKRTADMPQKTVDATWKTCSPETVAQGGWAGFSAAAYYFGRHLHQELDVPIGLIQTCWGGTIAEAWTSAEALMQMPDFKPTVEAFVASAEAKRNGMDTFEAQMDAWWVANDPGSAGGSAWAAPAVDASAWNTMPLPQTWEPLGGELATFNGIMWFRRDIDIPESLANQDMTISLGPIDDRDTTFFNGTKIGSCNDWGTARTYRIPAGLVKAGKNTVAIRVLDTGGNGGVYGDANQMNIVPLSGGEPISLAGEWRYKVGAPLSAVTGPPQMNSGGPNIVTVLYNAMIAPLLPYGIKGAIWYQGESNADRPEQYRTLLPTMIADWRNRFGVGKFPFFVVQLANFMGVQREPAEGGWATLREAQYLTAQNDPKVGLAVATDIGDERDIHPKNKQDVGKRLALSALKIAYGKDIVFSGPTCSKAEIEGSTIRLTFENIGGGLVARDGELKGFAIAGEDKQFVWADAVIDGKTIVVSSPDVAAPVAVRYNWASNPIGNLYNEEGLPASSFRTDVPPLPSLPL